MFQKRKGARYLKTLTPIERIMPHVMPKRSDSQVFFTDDIDCTAIDQYIHEKREQGIDMTYLDVFVAAAVRLYAKRPALNRFVMGGRIFANEKIWVSMALKKSLRDNEPSTTIKIPFTGHETIFEVKAKFDEQIHANKETGCVHACGHHCQSATLLGIAAVLKEPGALDGLCGSVRLMAVPAE